MRIDFEYGTGVMGAELPDELTDVFIPGKTVPDPRISRRTWLRRKPGNRSGIPLVWNPLAGWPIRAARLP